ncbi:MAG TPA: tetratricopeptide repeat protein [Pyrinomonadaceae bacterium]|nr:tetratricopeptide repeat protein [Pyrinomonadaceae bacterium]
MNPQAVDSIRFGEFVIDTRGRRLLRDGNRIALGPLEFKLLETLVCNRERVLTGDELRILVWSEDPSRQTVPAGDVNALYVSIRKLRAALGDSGKWIVNIPKVGYTVAAEAEIEKLTTTPSDLPQDVTPFVGRANEVALVRESINRSRIVTLMGPPGVGKTRLAKEAAKTLTDRFGSSIHFIDLASVVDGQYVPRALLSHFDLPDNLETDLKDGLSKFFADRPAAIVFDNCEHVIESASDVIETLLKSNRNLHVIATSREPMLLQHETVVMVAPLSTPPPDDSLTFDQLVAFEAPHLFIELTRQRRLDLTFEGRDLIFIAELCRQLEGIPVAIELAAAQVDAYSIEQIATLVEDRFRVFQRRGNDSSRHNTLDTAIEWSYNLLSEREQRLLRRLSVLKGGWTADIASNVCSEDEVSLDTIHLLAGLVRRSLVQMHSRKGANRYTMLEMIRQYGRLKLSEAGEEAPMLKKRTAVFLDLVERAFDDGNRGEWPAILDAEYDNLRAVLARTIVKEDDIVSGLRMCGSLSRFWFNHGHISEAQAWTKAALDKDDRSNPAARAKVLMAAGFFFGQTPGLDKDTERRRSYFEESIRLWEEVGDKNNLGITLVGYAFFLHRHGEYQEGIEVAERSVEILSTTENPVLLARAANNLALTLLETGEFQRALPILEKALRDARVSNDVFLEAVCLHNLAEVAFYLKDFDRSADFAELALVLFKSLGLRPNVARTNLMQSEIAAENGEISRALDLQQQVLTEFIEIGDHQGITDAFEVIAATLSKQGTHHELALIVMSAAASLRADLRIGRGPARDTLFRSQMKRSHAALGKAAAEAALNKGRILSIPEVTELMRSQGLAKVQT